MRLDTDGGVAAEKSASSRSTQVRFASDSPLEGERFEPSVPVAKELVCVAEFELRGIVRATIERGTPFRRRLDRPVPEYPLLDRIRKAGGTDYFALALLAASARFRSWSRSLGASTSSPIVGSKARPRTVL
jgi:hypothetical protein